MTFSVEWLGRKPDIDGRRLAEIRQCNSWRTTRRSK